MTAGEIFSTLKDWKHRFPERTEFVQAFAVGLLTWLVCSLFALNSLPLLRHLSDEGADQMMRLSETTTSSLDKSVGFAFIDVDDETWRDWGSPISLPRNRLKELIDAAARSNARLIVLDVDLAFRDDGNSEQALAAYLHDYPKAAPPLILVRNLIAAHGPGFRLPEARHTLYDPATAAALGANIRWATPLFNKDADGEVRRWRLFEAVCDAGKPAILPSIPLTVAAYVRAPTLAAKSGSNALDGSNGPLAPFIPGNCASPSAETAPVTLPVEQGSAPIVFDKRDLSQRILYRIGWKPAEAGLGPLIETDGIRTNLVQVRPARTVLAAGSLAPIPGLSGRITLIGGSFHESGDWHETPIGEMPGAMVMINAIHALIYSGTPRPPSPVLGGALTLLMIAITAAAATFFKPSTAAMVSGAAVLLVMIASLPLFKSGVVLNLAIPALGAHFHEKLTSNLKTLWNIYDERLRWLVEKKPAEPLKEPETK